MKHHWQFLLGLTLGLGFGLLTIWPLLQPIARGCRGTDIHMPQCSGGPAEASLAARGWI